jgi:hypothetical protein
MEGAAAIAAAEGNDIDLRSAGPSFSRATTSAFINGIGLHSATASAFERAVPLTPPSGEQGLPRHNFDTFFNPQLQLPTSSTAFHQLNSPLWQSPPPIFYNPMLVTPFVPPPSASFNGCESNGNAG